MTSTKLTQAIFRWLREDFPTSGGTPGSAYADTGLGRRPGDDSGRIAKTRGSTFKFRQSGLIVLSKDRTGIIASPSLAQSANDTDVKDANLAGHDTATDIKKKSHRRMAENAPVNSMGTANIATFDPMLFRNLLKRLKTTKKKQGGKK
jgi:hypothetical protein